MMYSPDSAIDGAVLDVILRKAEDIRKRTGVTVPLPDERGPVTDALMASMMLRRGNTKQMALDLRLDNGSRLMEARWRDVEENEKRSRARFAQNAMKPQEVAPEWEKTRSILGSPEAARSFIESAMSRFGVSLESRKAFLVAHIHALEAGLRERLMQRGMPKSVQLATSEPAPSGTELITRMHPLTATLAEALVEASIDPESLSDLGAGRVGAWPTPAVEHVTRVALLRIRYKLTIHARRERLLLAEEAALIAIHGDTIISSGDAARSLLNTPAVSNLAPAARDRFIEQAQKSLPLLIDGPISEFIRTRADELASDHARVRVAAGSASRVSVEGVHPPDVIGLFVLLPSKV